MKKIKGFALSLAGAAVAASPLAAEKLLALLTEKEAPAKAPKKKPNPKQERVSSKSKPVTKNLEKSKNSPASKKQSYQRKKHL